MPRHQDPVAPETHYGGPDKPAGGLAPTTPPHPNRVPRERPTRRR